LLLAIFKSNYLKKSICLAGEFKIVKEPNKLIPLIPEATDRETVLLQVGITEGSAIDVTQVYVPNNVRIELRRTPPMTYVADIVEAYSIKETARKT
jgi:hypothetical protein